MNETRKILIADHQSEVSEYLANFIPLLGKFAIDIVTNPLETLAKTNAFEPELVIYNYDKSVPHSKLTLQEIKEKHPKTHLLVLCDDEAEKKKLLAEGLTHVLSRPYDLSDLSQKVKDILPHEEEADAQEEAKLLVVDDEELIGDFIEDSLAPLGIQVFKAQSAREALKIFKEKKCNLAIIDIKMPEVSGIDLLKMLELSVSPPKPKQIVLISAALGDAISGIKRYEYPVMAKPLDLKGLEDHILEACKKCKLALKK